MDTDAGPSGMLRAYGACLLASFALFLALEARDAGGTLWMLAALGVALTGLGLAGPATTLHDAALRLGAVLLAAIALYLPVGTLLAQGEPLAGAIKQSMVWPQIVVCLFASRLLAETNEWRFARFWRNPAAAGGAPQAQSLLAALALGGAFTLAFYAALPFVTAHGATLEMVRAALEGETVIHYAIVLLFFTALAFLTDAALLQARERAVLAAVRLGLSGQGKPSHPGLTAVLERLRPRAAHRRSFLTIEAALDGETAPAALAGFHDASRRFFRALLSFLPLLGFLGTVVGLATAIGALPIGTGVNRGGGLDVAASLAGLALKFQTTLLGLVAAILSAALLAALEKNEAELDAECLRLVEATRGSADAH